MKKNHGFACLVAAGLCSLVPVPSHAAGGTVDIVLSANANVYAVEMGDTIVTAMGGNGTVTFIHSSGRPFVEGAIAAVQYAGLSKKTPSGLDLEADAVATFSSADTLLLLFERRSGDPGAADEGTLHLTGGSGRFAGVDGQCKYKADNLPGKLNVVATCQWLYSFPYR